MAHTRIKERLAINFWSPLESSPPSVIERLRQLAAEIGDSVAQGATTAPEGSASGVGPLRETLVSPKHRIFSAPGWEDAPPGDAHRLTGRAHVELLIGRTDFIRGAAAFRQCLHQNREFE